MSLTVGALEKLIQREQEATGSKLDQASAQVTALNEGFSPSDKDIADAQRVVATYDKAMAEGRGSIGLDGMMLDVPVVQRSERVLEIARRIAERQARARAV